MEYDSLKCVHIKVLTGLIKNFEYNWKVAINNLWAENYGCIGYGCTVWPHVVSIRLLLSASNSPVCMKTMAL